MTDLSVAEVLDRAADLIEPEGIWGCKHCAATAIWKAMGQSIGSEITKPVQRFFASFAELDPSRIPYSIYTWNDAPHRTQAEVVAKLREAAALARGQGK